MNQMVMFLDITNRFKSRGVSRDRKVALPEQLAGFLGLSHALFRAVDHLTSTPTLPIRGCAPSCKIIISNYHC